MREPLTLHESSGRTVFIIAAFAFLIGAGVRLANFQNEPITDELYHLLAAESWAEDGSLDIADGEYIRASLFTKFVGVVHTARDGDIDSIRVACIVIGALLVAVVAWWTTLHAGIISGATAGLLLAILPSAIFLSQYIRFYGLHALVFFLLAWCVWDFHGSTGLLRRAVLLGLAIILALVGLHLQVTTIVGIAGLALWLMLVNHRAILNALPTPKHRWIVGASIVATLLVLAIAMRGTLEVLLDTYFASALWNSSDTPLYYFSLYRESFGLFWGLAPAAFLLALVARPAPALFCTCIFVVAFVIQSLGGMRSERFMFYALPFFFIVWGIAADVAGRAAVGWLREELPKFSFFTQRPSLTRSLSCAGILAIGCFALVMAPFVETSVKMTLGKRTDPPDYWDRYRTNWGQAAAFLRKVREQHEVVIASQPLHAIYYLGDVDYALNATTLADIAPPGTHAAIDPRTGRLLFDDVATLQAVTRCHRSGAIIIHGPAFGNPTRVDQNVADYFVANFEQLSIPVKTDLLVFRWQGNVVSNSCRLRNNRWVPDGD